MCGAGLVSSERSSQILKGLALDPLLDHVEGSVRLGLGHLHPPVRQRRHTNSTHGFWVPSSQVKRGFITMRALTHHVARVANGGVDKEVVLVAAPQAA